MGRYCPFGNRSVQLGNVQHPIKTFQTFQSQIKYEQETNKSSGSIKQDDEISCKSLSSLLKTLNLEKYEQVLKEAGVTDLETFAILSDTDLKDTIGISLLGPRRKMTSAIEKLRVTS